MFRARQTGTRSSHQKGAADQPRPALGRRPWFALLRRARSLRRFALAIRSQIVAGSPVLLTVAARDGSWGVASVYLASSPYDRLRGVKAGHSSVLLQTRSVHGRGLEGGLCLVAIDSYGSVVAVTDLRPNSVVRIRRAVWILELPGHHPPPGLGTSLAIYARSCGRQTHSVCNSNRKSR